MPPWPDPTLNTPPAPWAPTNGHLFGAEARGVVQNAVVDVFAGAKPQERCVRNGSSERPKGKLPGRCPLCSCVAVAAVCFCCLMSPESSERRKVMGQVESQSSRNRGIEGALLHGARRSQTKTPSVFSWAVSTGALPEQICGFRLAKRHCLMVQEVSDPRLAPRISPDCSLANLRPSQWLVLQSRRFRLGS